MRLFSNIFLPREKIDVKEEYEHRYKIVREIADGATALVHLGVDLENGKNVIIKEFNYGGYIIKLFNPLREILLLKYLSENEKDSTYFCKYLDSYKTKIGCNIIMDYDNKYEDMFTFMSKKPKLSYRTIYELTVNLIDGLNCMHKKGIAHRDIKFENLLINKEENTIKYIDFGGSICKKFKKMDNKVKHPYEKFKNIFYRVEGTTDYFPPEILQVIIDQHNENVKSFDYTYTLKDAFKHDVWCLGLVIYQLINYDKSECCPYTIFDNDTPQDIYLSINIGEWNKNINLDKFTGENFCPNIDMQYLIFWMLNINPKLRPTSHELYNYIHS